ncbi:hypothetical protein N825_22875 [Skermanella stibiiresistens SB22]|uniref:Uncharacterized protein n=2 Tax=Skermanella TaxID=204447 RepID=W9GT54_9PROT|nr:hypothetical protein N825_22875 [Skermanella stibiiresistens SB22]
MENDAALLALGVSLVTDMAIKEAKSFIEREVKMYEASFSARAAGQFYREDGELRYLCFRMSRSVADIKEPVFDFYGKFELSPDAAAVHAIPLYLNYSHTKARTGSGGRFVSNMILTIETVWMDERKDVRAVKETAFTSNINFGQLSLDKPALRLNGVDESAASTWFPSVPRSVLIDDQGKVSHRGDGNFTITATVFETAAAKDVMAQLLKVVQENEEAIRRESTSLFSGD